MDTIVLQTCITTTRQLGPFTSFQIHVVMLLEILGRNQNLTLFFSYHDNQSTVFFFHYLLELLKIARYIFIEFNNKQ